MSSPSKRSGESARFPRWIQGVLAVCVWLGVWQLASTYVDNAILIASPVDTLLRLGALVQTSAFWMSLWTSLSRIVCSFALAFVLALVLAGTAQMFRLLEVVLRPFMMAVKATPVVCIVVILLIWLGSSMVVQASVMLVVLPALYFSVLEGLRAQDSSTQEMLQVFGVGALRRFLVFVWPSLRSYLMATCEMLVGMSWKAGVASELISMPLGSVGERIYQSKLLLLTSDLFAWTIAVVLVAYACERVVLWLLSSSFVCSSKLALLLSRRGSRMEAEPGGFKLEQVSMRLGNRQILQDVSLELPEASRSCFVDPSGTGKTTTLRLLSGLLYADKGHVHAPKRVSMAWQATCLLEELSAVDNICLVAGCSTEEAHNLLSELLPRDVHSCSVSQLSGGEKRRVEVVRALAAPSSAVLLDEPFASLDEASHLRCAEFICKHIKGRTLVVATHDVRDAFYLDAGEIYLAKLSQEAS